MNVAGGKQTLLKDFACSELQACWATMKMIATIPTFKMCKETMNPKHAKNLRVVQQEHPLSKGISAEHMAYEPRDVACKPTFMSCEAIFLGMRVVLKMLRSTQRTSSLESPPNQQHG